MKAPARRGPLLLAAALLIAAGVIALAIGLASLWPGQPGPVAVQPSPTAEPLLPPPPTATAEPPLPPPATIPVQPRPPSVPAEPSLPPPPADTPRLTPSAPADEASSSATSTPPPGLYALRHRLGVCAAGKQVTSALARQLGFGWYLDWATRPGSLRTAQVQYLPMIRVRDGRPNLGGAALEEAVRALPGSVWLIGNEPDVPWQDDVAPDAYAQVFHDLYSQLKALDPSCRVAIGGVSQPTPLRLKYLDRVLESYQAQFGRPMPVEVWNIHNFILREERDGWGVDIPPGLDEPAGVLRDIADHDALSIFKEQIVGFRRWMKERGQQDKELLLSEYGILMPGDYGFPPERVERYMLDTFEFLRTATDPETGLPADGFRLVQRWCWYSLADPVYPTGNLLDREGGTLSRLGQAFRRYAYGTH